MLDRRSGRALYQQLADELRTKITRGELPPGSTLQSEGDIAAEYGMGRDAVRQALVVLRGEGLVVTERGRRSVVRQVGERVPVHVGTDAVVTARMPTPTERAHFDLPEGVPLLVVRTAQGEAVHAGDRAEVRYRTA
jgi:DNA-binding GntR family transcriptional regulator